MAAQPDLTLDEVRQRLTDRGIAIGIGSIFSARIDVSDASVGTKKRALRSKQETDEGKLRRPGTLLDKENPIQGPCADSEEKHEPVSDVDIAVAVSLKVLDLDGRLEKLTSESRAIMSASVLRGPRSLRQ